MEEMNEIQLAEESVQEEETLAETPSEDVGAVSEPAEEFFDGEDGAEEEDGEGETEERETEDGHRVRAEEDLLALQSEFPEMRGKSLADLPSPRRFGELRELGLSPREAYLATRERVTVGGKSHLRASQPTHSVSRTSAMTAGEMREAASLFPKLSGREIVSLYKRVNSVSPRN